MADKPAAAGASLLLARLALLFGALLLTLAILEVAARVLHLGSGGFWEPYALYGWRNIPNASGWESCYGECAVHVDINALGLRDEAISYELQPEQKRILLLGDSMTAGMQVELEATYAKVLQSELNGDAADRPWQVINGSVNGFGTDNELLFYRWEGYKYQPDYVFLGLYLANDVYNNSHVLEQRYGGDNHKPYFELDAAGELQLHNFPMQKTESASVRIGSFLKKNFQLPRFIAQTMRLRGEVPPLLRPLVSFFTGERGVGGEIEGLRGAFGVGNICAETYHPEVAQAWEITKALLVQLRSEVAAQGAELVVIALPAAPQVDVPQDGTSWYCDQANHKLREFLEAEGIQYLDMLEPFRQHMLQGGPRLYFQRDFHFNAEGHRLAGKLLAEYVTDGLSDP